VVRRLHESRSFDISRGPPGLPAQRRVTSSIIDRLAAATWRRTTHHVPGRTSSRAHHLRPVRDPRRGQHPPRMPRAESRRSRDDPSPDSPDGNFPPPIRPRSRARETNQSAGPVRERQRARGEQYFAASTSNTRWSRSASSRGDLSGLWYENASAQSTRCFMIATIWRSHHHLPASAGCITGVAASQLRRLGERWRPVGDPRVPRRSAAQAGRHLLRRQLTNSEPPLEIEALPLRPPGDILERLRRARCFGRSRRSRSESKNDPLHGWDLVRSVRR